MEFGQDRYDRFRQLAATAPFGIFETDAEGSAVYVNPWLCRLSGESESDAVAGGWATAVHPDDEADVEQAWSAALASGTAFCREHRLVRLDGSPLWVVTTGTPIRDPDGTITGFLGTVEDVTDRRLAAARVDASEARFRQLRRQERRALVEVSPDPTIVVAADQIVFANPAALALFGASDLRELAEHGGVDERFVTRPDACEGPARNAGRGGERTHGPDKVEFRRLDGTIGTAEIISSRFSHEGRPAVLLAARDVSERARLESQLRQAQKMEAVGRLAGGVAHDFNNLLAAIMGYAELALTAIPPDDEVHSFVSEIVRAADSASHLTRRLLTFSRQQPPSNTVVDLNDVVHDLRPMLRQVTDERTRLLVRLASEPAYVRLDPGLVEQAVLNLVINARDAMTNPGTIVVRVGFRTTRPSQSPSVAGLPPGRYATLSVADTGGGIAPEHLPHVFEPFFTTKPATKGTGLGLAIVYSVVKGAGGGVVVDSDVGRGTRFDLLLPLAEQPTGEQHLRAPVAGDSLGGTESLLVVEDETAIRRLVERILSEQGYRVRTAASAEEALTLLDEAPAPELLVTDVRLPAMSGPQLANAARARMPGLGVLFVSGYSADRLAPDGALEPGSAFLAKPFSSEDLVRSVRHTLDSLRYARAS